MTLNDLIATQYHYSSDTTDYKLYEHRGKWVVLAKDKNDPWIPPRTVVVTNGSWTPSMKSAFGKSVEFKSLNKAIEFINETPWQKEHSV